MTNEQIAQSELGMIASYVDEFAEKETDSTYMCVLRLLEKYRGLQSLEMEEAIRRETERKKCL